MSKLSSELGFLARKELSLILDKHSPRGHDWRGLCDLMGFTYEVNIALNQQESPTLSLLEEWERSLGSQATLDLLITHLENLECLEAVAVLKKAKAKKRERIDCGGLTSNGQLSPRSPRSPRQARLSTDSTGSANSNGPYTPTSSLTSSFVQSQPEPSYTIDATVLTEKIEKLMIEEKEAPRNDLEQSLRFIQSQRYDVFLSYANVDREFAEEVRQRLTIQAKLRVFVPLDELMPGYVFSDQIADMIKSGCRKTIIILSPDYIESEWCSYEARLALHQSPECRKHVLIPILFRQCDVPAFMQHIYYLDFPRYKDSTQCEKYFWQRLYKSLVYDGRRRS